MIARSWEQEIDLELLKKWKPVQIQIAGTPSKKPRTFDF